MNIDVFTLFPGPSSGSCASGTSPTPSPTATRADLPELSRQHAARRGAGRRLALRRRCRDGDARGCRGRRARGGLRLESQGGLSKIALAPSGRLLDEALAAELAEEPHLALLCGRYEGFDERVVEHLADESISIGRYVLAGGELPAMVIADTVLRKLPGRPRGRRERRGGVLQRGARGGAGVSALHPPGDLPRLGGPRGPSLGQPREGEGVAPGSKPRPHGRS